jgi:hypothetical protein
MLTFQTHNLGYWTESTLFGKKTRSSIINQLNVKGLTSKKNINYIKESKLKNDN